MMMIIVVAEARIKTEIKIIAKNLYQLTDLHDAKELHYNKHNITLVL